MQITANKVDELNATLSIKMEPADYQPKYEAALKNYSKKVSMKGFRPGTAPLSMVKKIYGKSVLAEEVNKLINDSIYNYIKENNLDVLGNPLPSASHNDVADFDNPGDFEFFFDLGLAPQFNVNLADISIPFYKIKVDEKMLNQQIDDIARRNGKLENVDVSTDNDMLLVAFNELKEGNEIKEGGIFHSSTVALEFIEDADTKNKLTGVKPGDKIIVDPKKLSHSATDLGAMLGIDAHTAEALDSLFQITVNEVRRMNKAELDQELFDKMFGPGNVTSLEEFKNRVSAELEKNFNGDSKNFFHREARISLINKLNIALPKEFLKRWIIAQSDKPVDEHQLEHEFDHYADDLRWQLIESKILKEYNIQIDRSEVLKYTKENLAELYARYNLPPLDDESLTKHAENILTKKEEVQNAVQRATTRKVIDTIQEKVKLQEKEVSFDELMVHYKELQEREHAHHAHAHQHEHSH